MNLMSYVDGFVLVVPKDKRDEYRKMADDAAKAWIKHGAKSYMECVGDDMNPDWCKLPFPEMTKASQDEEVWYSFIVYENKADRDRVNAAVMKEMEEQGMSAEDCEKEMPFDMHKMAYGGFQAMVEYRST